MRNVVIPFDVAGRTGTIPPVPVTASATGQVTGPMSAAPEQAGTTATRLPARPEPTLATVGGKARNLIRLAEAGLPVPAGFVLTTDAYREHVDVAALHHIIELQLSSLGCEDADNTQALEQVSTAIRGAFRSARMPSWVRAQLADAYHALGVGPVAVRSSATAEDLPDLSFAGQQDTFLGVQGLGALVEAVIDCWSSLWTARAIGYRAAHGLAGQDVALAVVVQRLVDAEVSGVLFTANPLTGRRDQSVVDATYGLGESLVSGQVDPDHFVVESVTGKILERRAGAKSVATVRRSGGGVETVTRASDGAAPAAETLTDDDIRHLVGLGRRVLELYDGTPQDIEWALANGRFHLLQTRAITSLYPLPVSDDDAHAVWISFGAVQGMLEPISPLGRDALRVILSSSARTFGHTVDPESTPYVREAGERLWIRLDRVLRHPLGRRFTPAFLEYVEPGSTSIVRPLLHDPRMAQVIDRQALGVIGDALGFEASTLGRTVRHARHPERLRAELDAAATDLLDRTARMVAAAEREPTAAARLRERTAVLRRAPATGFPILIERFAPIMMPGMAMLHRLRRFADEVGHPDLPLEITRSLSGNVTAEMDRALWAAAEQVRADVPARERVLASDPEELVSAYHAGTLPPVAQGAVSGYLASYGMRGVGEIDLGRPRWREDPVDVFRTLTSYVEIGLQGDARVSPEAAVLEGARRAEAAIDELAGAVRRTRGGAAKALFVRFAGSFIRATMGARETPKFVMIQVLGMVRTALLDSGADLVAAGVLDRPDDLVYLQLHELEELSYSRWSPAGSSDDGDRWRRLVAVRRAAADREARRRPIPRMMLGDGTTFLEGYRPSVTSGEAGRIDDERHLHGSAVSPGVAEGEVRVVHDPRQTRLLPGEILVCAGTDPAWTPLFLSAAALITEVGGIMTHGSVVAREYGIPAVVGVDRATERLRTGQRIRVDGSTGTIELL